MTAFEVKADGVKDAAQSSIGQRPKIAASRHPVMMPRSEARRTSGTKRCVPHPDRIKPQTAHRTRIRRAMRRRDRRRGKRRARSRTSPSREANGRRTVRSRLSRPSSMRPAIGFRAGELAHNPRERQRIRRRCAEARIRDPDSGLSLCEDTSPIRSPSRSMSVGMTVAFQNRELFAALLASGRGQQSSPRPSLGRYDAVQVPQIPYSVAQRLRGLSP